MAGWGELFEKGAEAVGDGIDWGTRKVGEGVDEATDLVGEGLEHVGAAGWADKVEDWGDEAASKLGAAVGEARLGETDEPDELVHGKAGDINATARNLRDFQSAFDSVGKGLKGLPADQWKGEAAQAFREKFRALPPDWLRAADAFGAAAGALETYAHTVTWAQGRAREAIGLHKEAESTSKAAADAYKKKVDAYEAARTGDDPLPEPAAFTDPADAQRARAGEILADARRQRDEAAERAKGAITAALAHAPAEPSAKDRLRMDAGDLVLAQSTELLHLAGGVAKGVVGMTNFVRSVYPLDPYNITHPAAYYENLSMTLAGLASTAAHPDRALKNAWGSAKADPSEFVGRLLPELIGTKGVGGLKSLTRLKQLERLEEAAPGGKGSVRGGHEKAPDAAGRTHNDLTCEGDPVDMATGRVVLPQTDIALPGALPLLFTRHYESSRRTGRWFGPTWASTLDQRLEIDAEGVVLLCEDGSILAFPHPAPGVPVLPTHGARRWALDRDASGDTYTVTAPETGAVRHFATAEGGEEAALVQIDDRNGNWITFGYDAEGAPTEVVHHGGYRLRLTTEGARVTALRLDGQQVRRYGYTDGHLTSVTDSSGLPTVFGCDEHGRMTSWTDTNGHRYDYVYDEHDRCVWQSGRDGVMAGRFTWNVGESTYTDALGRTTRFEVDERARITAETGPDGAVTRFTHDGRGRVLSRTDPLGHTTLFAYDEEGRLSSVTRPDGRKLSAEYDPELGLPVKVTRADGTRIRQTYDARGNRTSVTEPSGARTEFAYDDRGRLESVADPLGAVTRIRTDPAGLPVSVTDPLGATTVYERDGFGRTVRMTDAMGAETRLEWTQEGRLARRIAPDGSAESWTYDGEGNCLTHTDALGGTTAFTYGDFDVLTSRTDRTARGTPSRTTRRSS